MKWTALRRRVVILFLTLCASTLIFLVGKVWIRTIETLAEARTPSEHNYDLPEELKFILEGLEDGSAVTLMMTSLRDQLADSDGDGDGLSDWDELVRFTDKESSDSDGDGLGDSDDACPNSSPGGVRSIALSRALSSAIGCCGQEEFESDPKVIYVQLSGFDSIELPCRGNTFVGVGGEGFSLLRQSGFAEVFVAFEEVILLPGLIYSYRIQLTCGRRCGWGKVVLLFDIPFVGPRPFRIWTFYEA